MSGEDDETGFCASCGREIGVAEWAGDCTACEEELYACKNDQCGNLVSVEDEYCLRCEKILTDMEIESRYDAKGDEE